MPQHHRFSRIFSLTPLSSILVLVLFGATCLAQEQPSTTATQAGAPNAQPTQKSNILVPAGTRIGLVLTHPIQSRHIHRGDDIYAQITDPVTSGEELAIPPGTFIQGKVDRLGHKGQRGELHFQSMSIAFPNGYVALVSGSVDLESDDGYALKDPGNGRGAAAFILPMAGTGLGALIGHAAASSKSTTIVNTLPEGCTGPPPGCLTSTMTVPPFKGKSTFIGLAVGGGIGTAASLLILSGSHGFYLDAGSPMEMTLRQPLSLDRDRVADAIQNPPNTPVRSIGPAPGTIFTRGNSPMSCSPGQELCKGSCTDTIEFMNDSSNCGRCGNHCSFNETCTGGSCGCGPGTTSCMGSCISHGSLMGDNSNCGRCGNHCSFNESCMGGTCTRTMPCTPGEIGCH